MKKRIPALLLALALLGSLPVFAAGSEAPAPADLFTLGQTSEYGHIALSDESGDMDTADEITVSAQAAMAAIESVSNTSYDSRALGIVTPVRAQGSYNTCWAVAAMGAAELDGLKSGLLTTGAADTDLSERHLIYFLSHPADDPLGNSTGDYNIAPSFWIRSGGNPQLATMTLAGWHGAATEAGTDSPYSGLSSADKLSASYAYTDVLHLENTYALDASTPDQRAVVQTMIREHGGAVLCLYYDESYLFAGSPAAAEISAATAAADVLESPEVPETAPEPEGEANTELVPEAEPESGPAPADEPEDELASPDEPEDTSVSEDMPGEESAPMDESENESAPEIEPAPDAEPENEPTPEVEPEDDSDPAVEPESGPAFEDEAVPVADPTDEPELSGLDGAAGAEVVVDGADAADFTVCYYQNVKSGTTNHEMLVVGWDDDYPAANFALSSAGAKPAGNGAWLCRNSYGPNWAGGDGYVWVSYYDTSVSYDSGGSIAARFTVFDFTAANDYAHNYEYDGAAILGYVNDEVGDKGISTLTASSGTRRWYANVFTARGNGSANGAESLRAVSTYTYRSGVPYTVEVYTDLKNTASPTAGTLAATVSGAFSYAGFHTVVLPDAVTLAEDESFSVVFRVGASADCSVFVPACYTNSTWHSVNDSAPGQSFVSLDGGSWIDCQTLEDHPNVRIKAYTDDITAPLPFTDVKADAWYYSDVEAGWLKGLVNGLTATTYQPAAAATRAQVVTTLWRLSGKPLSSTAAPYPDIEDDSWYADAVDWAHENGIVTGYSSGLFCPNAPITRQDLMTVLCRYARLKGLNTTQTASLSAFPDQSSVGAWAKDAVTWSVAAGLLNGVADADSTRLDPAGSVTRAQLAAFLNRFSQMN